eukprot:c16248_g1_i3.p1 GENE.c16248_g1_i3~~c16248_g1_i3.p1  ORF type:complete len:234 (-),score=45.73 c16248_g1_i3:184-885(-)
MSWAGLRMAPTFHPSKEQWSDPMAYIQSIHEQGSQFGIIKIEPPLECAPDFKFDLHRLSFPTRVQNIAKLSRRRLDRPKPERLQPAGEPDDIGFNSGRNYNYDVFKRLGDALQNKLFGDTPPTEEVVEKMFWDIVENRADDVQVLYGSDLDSKTHGSGFTSRAPWSLNSIARGSTSLLNVIDADINGITTSWLYVGMMFSTFCWHNEGERPQNFLTIDLISQIIFLYLCKYIF